MIYQDILPAEFIDRPNRFIAHCKIDGSVARCHVKNTGRCKELLYPGANVFVQKAANPHRSTKYDLIAVQKGERLINIDSQAPNQIFSQWLAESGFFPSLSLVKPEVYYGSSRFDFYIEAEGRKIYAEVKGVTLEENGVALFPDAPTARGVKHLNGLCDCISNGFEALVVFIIQMENIRYFTPNDSMHAEFGNALRHAYRQGVKILALDCRVAPERITAQNPVEIIL